MYCLASLISCNKQPKSRIRKLSKNHSRFLSGAIKRKALLKSSKIYAFPKGFFEITGKPVILEEANIEFILDF